jgi:hypothetical protein
MILNATLYFIFYALNRESIQLALFTLADSSGFTQKILNHKLHFLALDWDLNITS